MNRRGFLAGILALGVAPAIVRASSLMRVRPNLFTGEWVELDGLNLVDDSDALVSYAQTITIDQMRSPPGMAEAFAQVWREAYDDLYLRSLLLNADKLGVLHVPGRYEVSLDGR